MLSQRSCDDVVDDAIEFALRLAQEVVRVRMKGGFGNGIYVGARNGFSKLTKIAVAGIQV